MITKFIDIHSYSFPNGTDYMQNTQRLSSWKKPFSNFPNGVIQESFSKEFTVNSFFLLF